MRNQLLPCVLLLGAVSVAGAQQKRPAVHSKTTSASNSGAPKTVTGFYPLALDPVNPHYFRFRGRTTALLTSGEHYGAVLNGRFDFAKYLETLEQSHLNLARIFNGAYLETLDSAVYRGGDQNTLAPTSQNYVAPWWRLEDGRFDLAQWNDGYFARLKGFVAEASKRNVAVEVSLFSVIYGSGRGGWGSWNLNPFNPANNINKAGALGWDHFTTLGDPALVALQDALVRRTVTELNGFDNVYYEVCNEPYFSGATARETEEWSNHVIGTIVQTESKLPNQHLIAQNVANGFASVTGPNPSISVFNFHYASPPAAIPLNWGLKKPIAFDETADGCTATDRRKEAWAFLLSGGAVYSNLDPSFATGDPTGTGKVPAADRSYDCSEIRYQLAILQAFLGRFEIQFLQPDSHTLRQWPLGASDAYLMSEPGRAYALYLKASGSRAKQSMLILDLPPGRYQPEWLNPRTGDNDKGQILEHKGGMARLLSPDYTEDLALRLSRLAEPAENTLRTTTKAAPKSAARPSPGRAR